MDRLVMDRFVVPKPCSQDASKMAKTPMGFYCAACEHSVIDATRMTRAAFLRVVEDRKKSGDRVCARVRTGDDGEASFRAPPPPARIPRRRFAGGLVLLSALTSGGCGVGVADVEPAVTVQPALASIAPDEAATAVAPAAPLNKQRPAARVEPPEEFLLGEIEHVPAPAAESDPQP